MLQAFPSRPQVVGVVYSGATLQAALALPALPAAPDWLELRADAFAANPEALAELAAGSARSLLLTVRHPLEGGLNGELTDAERERLYRRYLPMVAAIDVEVRSLDALAGTIVAARAQGCLVVASCHDFTGAPPLAELRAAAARGRDAGADLFKAAAVVESPGDLATLFALLEAEPGSAVMGMGRLGRASRPALAAAGSRLNYGYLGAEAQVAGQWPVAELRARIDELLE